MITGPGLFVVTALELMLLPALLLVACSADLARVPRRFSYVRFVAALTWTLWMHVAGLVALWATPVIGGGWLGRHDRQRRFDTRVQGWWARGVWGGAARVYRMTLEVRGDDVLDVGGFVLLSRHASILDTILPLVLLADGRGQRVRYVIKRQLLWDPCVDVAGDRYPTAFVRRGGAEHEADIARVSRLLDDLGAHDVVVMYPEGTRFSEPKRARVLRSLARKNPEAAAWAKTLRHVLPPHPGGTHALLRENEHDIVFCAHTGLEPANHFVDLLDGSLLDAKVVMQFWRVPARELPGDPVERERWLRAFWTRIDDWIGDNGSARTPRRALNRS